MDNNFISLDNVAIQDIRVMLAWTIAKPLLDARIERARRTAQHHQLAGDTDALVAAIEDVRGLETLRHEYETTALDTAGNVLAWATEDLNDEEDEDHE